MIRAVIAIENLREAACLAAVERAVLAHDGLTGLEVDLNGTAIVVDFDEQVTDELDLRTRVGLVAERADGSSESRWGAS